MHRSSQQVRTLHGVVMWCNKISSSLNYRPLTSLNIIPLFVSIFLTFPLLLISFQLHFVHHLLFVPSLLLSLPHLSSSPLVPFPSPVHLSNPHPIPSLPISHLPSPHNRSLPLLSTTQPSHPSIHFTPPGKNAKELEERMKTGEISGDQDFSVDPFEPHPDFRFSKGSIMSENEWIDLSDNMEKNDGYVKRDAQAMKERPGDNMIFVYTYVCVFVCLFVCSCFLNMFVVYLFHLTRICHKLSFSLIFIFDSY